MFNEEKKMSNTEKRGNNTDFYFSPQKHTFHGFKFLITNIRNINGKNDKITINKLLNSSKCMIRDNFKYKSCFDLSRNYYYYPYKPEFVPDKKTYFSKAVP